MKCPLTHKMADGTVMTGKTHSAKSKMIVPTAKCMPKNMMVSIPKKIKRMP